MKDLNIVKRKLSELKRPDKNIRLHPDRQIKELKRSVEKNGQTRLLVIDENNVVWIGNGLCQAMKEMGLKEAYCLVKSGMTEMDKRKMMASDNRIYDLGLNDMKALDEFLKELGDDYDVPGYDEELLRTLTADLPDVDEIASSYGIIDEDKKEEFQAARKAYEKDEAEFAAMSQDSPVQPVPGADNRYTPTDTETAAQEDSGDYVICPNCGQKIWL